MLKHSFILLTITESEWMSVTERELEKRSDSEKELVSEYASESMSVSQSELVRDVDRDWESE